MSIQLFVSNALPKLAAQMASDLKQNKSNVFAPEQIITQTEGMNNWLKICLSQHLGIAANLVFGKPSDLISKIWLLRTAGTDCQPFRADTFSERNFLPQSEPMMMSG